MARDLSALMREVLASPLGDVIAAVGEGVAEAQEALDAGSIAKTLELYREGGDEMINLMREIGYQPTFYTLPETIGEVNVALSLGQRATASPARSPVTSNQPTGTLASGTIKLANVASALADRRKLPVRTYATPVDANYSNRYSFSAQASTKLTFKIVPIPPPEAMERIRMMPDLVTQKRTVAEATLVLEILDLEVAYENEAGDQVSEPDGKAAVKATRPPAGEIATTDGIVTLIIG